MSTNRKKQVLEALFNHCKENNDFIFHSELVKEFCSHVGFGNHFDVCKLDNSDKIPQAMKDEDY